MFKVKYKQVLCVIQVVEQLTVVGLQT